MNRWLAIATVGWVVAAAPSALATPPTSAGLHQAADRADPRRAPEVQLDGTVDRYVAYAVANHPQLRAAFDTWQLALHRIAPAGTPANPTVDFAVFVRSVETRVGPQQARVSLTQAFPWPTALSAQRGAAASDALAAQHAFDAHARQLTAQVEQAYWNLWELRTTRDTHTAHLDVVQGLSTTVAARLEVGDATLADLQQVDLSNARLADHIATLSSTEAALEAQLRRAVGLRDRLAVPTTCAPPDAHTPDASLQVLTEHALEHPALGEALAHTEAAQQQTRVARAERLPSFRLGADWIATGPSSMGGIDDSGKDAVAARVGVTVPLWQGASADRVRAAEAAVRRSEAQADGLRDDLVATLDQVLAELHDSDRRIRVIEGTLLPQAQATYESLLGSLAVGQGSIAQVLLTQRDLLELTVDAHRAKAQHARAWAALHHLTGPVDDR